MSDHTLAIDYTSLRREIGRSIGYRREPSRFTPDEKTDVDDCIRSGCSQAYWPSNQHKWSFLKPYREIVVTADQDDYDLPDDFGSFEDKLSYSKDDNSWFQLDQVNPQQIMYLRENNQTTTTGYPQKFGVAPRKHDGGGSQLHYLLVWPKPDQTYKLKGPMRVIPRMLSEERPFPYGGPEMGELILSSCLSAAELKINGEKGSMTQDFAEKLEAAVAIDAQKVRGIKVGYNSNRGDGLRGSRYVLDNHIVTYDGTEYNGP